jgi:hypothetical protein
VIFSGFTLAPRSYGSIRYPENARSIANMDATCLSIHFGKHFPKVVLFKSVPISTPPPKTCNAINGLSARLLQ